MLIYSARCPMSQILAKTKSLSRLSHSRLLGVSSVSRLSRSRLLRVSSVCRTSSLVVSGVSKLARHPSTISAVHSPSQRSCALSASLCVEPSCSRHHPCSTGSWDLGIPISLWVFCPLWVSAQLHSLWGRRESIPACRSTFIL